jgi:hypothetical protein
VNTAAAAAVAAATVVAAAAAAVASGINRQNNLHGTTLFTGGVLFLYFSVRFLDFAL